MKTYMKSNEEHRDVLHCLRKDSITMSKVVNGWTQYSESKFQRVKSKCECGHEETWEHVFTCSKNKGCTNKLIGNISRINLQHNVSMEKKTAMHKSLRENFS